MVLRASHLDDRHDENFPVHGLIKSIRNGAANHAIGAHGQMFAVLFDRSGGKDYRSTSVKSINLTTTKLCPIHFDLEFSFASEKKWKEFWVQPPKISWKKISWKRTSQHPTPAVSDFVNPGRGQAVPCPACPACPNGTKLGSGSNSVNFTTFSWTA